MPDLEPDLEFSVWGLGLSHMAYGDLPPCEKCHGTQLVGHRHFPIPCPTCSPVRLSSDDAGHDA